MHIHLVGVAGTGMGALAGLLRKAGHRVTGSDTAFYPPIGPALATWGVETMQGFDARHLEPRPDLVIVGNVCRKDNPEARAAIERGIPYDSMPGAIEKFFLAGGGDRAPRPGFVVAGTHGKTTTTALLAFLLHRAGVDPGLLVGGVPRDFGESFRLGGPDAPFVIEGDEYDSAFFEKSPKFLRYRPRAVILTSIEHDHVDIYPTMETYRAAFQGLVDRIPEDGLLVAWAGDPEVRAVARTARCRVRFYAMEGDACGDVTPEWLAFPAPPQGGMQPFDLFFGGSSCGRATSALSGAHNVRNAVAAVALAAEGAGVAVQPLVRSLATFGGIKRRQELRGTADGVAVYDDFAHHPTAVRETIAALRARHPEGRVVAVFEPRSATAARNTHQREYPQAFAGADHVVLAPVGRPEIPASERLDLAPIAAELRARGVPTDTPADLEGVIAATCAAARRGDAVLVMSNGAFGGIHDRLLAALTTRLVAARLGVAPRDDTARSTGTTP
jgi:UDP-N-acetylmuramate: L-alanyl-gamma-D-glutamyl-meso-diaminopimelate ligase